MPVSNEDRVGKKAKSSSVVESQCESRIQLCDPMDCSPLGSSARGILQARSWSGLPCPSPGDSRPRDRTHFFGIAGRFITI